VQPPPLVGHGWVTPSGKTATFVRKLVYKAFGWVILASVHAPESEALHSLVSLALISSSGPNVRPSPALS